jgi:alkylation response protein AidB-like acyl-CoA dehydrogenase
MLNAKRKGLHKRGAFACMAARRNRDPARPVGKVETCDARLMMIGEGASGIQRRVIARQALGLK